MYVRILICKSRDPQGRGIWIVFQLIEVARERACVRASVCACVFFTCMFSQTCPHVRKPVYVRGNACVRELVCVCFHKGVFFTFIHY